MYVIMMDKVNKLLKVFLFICLFITMASLAIQVFLRFALNYSLSWPQELARYLVIWITFIGAGIAVRNNRLANIEILLVKMPIKMKRLIVFIAGIISFIFYGLLIYFGIDILQTVNGQQSSALQLSMAIPYAAIPVGAFLMICNTLAYILDKKEGGNVL